MKTIKTLTSLLAIAAVLATVKVSAFPLKLTKFNGTFTVTPSYSAVANANKANFTVKSFKLKNVLWMVTNQVALNTGTCPPKGSWIAWDNSYAGSLGIYLTNNANGGYIYSLYNNGSTQIANWDPLDDMATSFKANKSEKDKFVGGLWFNGYGPDGYYYEFQMYGAGFLTNSIRKGVDTMIISGRGADYGEYKSSYDGVSNGSFTFRGSGDPSFWKSSYKSYWLWWED